MAGAIGGLIIGNNIARLQAGIAAATVAWKALEARGLTLVHEDVKGLAIASGKVRPALTGTIDGVACAVRISSDFVHCAYTKVSATPPNGAEVTVGVHPNPAGIYGKIRLWLGQDIEVGDAAFDDAYLITGKPAAAAVEMLTPARRDRIVGLAGAHFAGLVYEQHEVVVLLGGVVTEPDALGAAIDLALDVSRS